MIVGNWKMHTRAADAHILATAVRNYAINVPEVEMVVCPPFVWLSEVAHVLNKGKAHLGAQNMYFELEGAYTGEVSPLMIKDLAQYVIIGHSERREYFEETDLDVNEKVIAALKVGLFPIVCVGEKKKSSRYPQKVVDQLKGALASIPKKHYKDLIVAYEPIWAIGTGMEAEPEYAAKVITQLRTVVKLETPILYGGSVNSKNTAGFAGHPEIDGLLVGGASLKAAEFCKIAQVWHDKKGFK